MMLTPRQDRPAPAALRDLHFSVLRAASGLPRFRLYPEERMRLAGSAFLEAPQLVDAVCRAVEEGAALLQDLPFDPAAVREGQARARRYAELHGALLFLAERAHDLFLFEQAEATAQSMAVLRAGRCRLAEPHHSPAHRQLDDAIRPAEQVLEERAAAARRGRPATGRRARRRPRFSDLGFAARIGAALRRAHAVTPPPPGGSQKKGPAAFAAEIAVPRSPATSTQAGAPMAHPITPTSTPAPPAVPTDIAAAAAIRGFRQEAAGTSADLNLARLSAEQRAETGPTLSADELEAAQAAVRLFGAEDSVGDEAGVPPDLFERTLDIDLALCGLGRAAGQLEATAAVGEIVASARLTELCDRVFAAAESDALPPEAREVCAAHLASTGELIERREQLLSGRKARAALRRGRHAAELGAAEEETERLRGRNQMLSENRGGR